MTISSIYIYSLSLSLSLSVGYCTCNSVVTRLRQRLVCRGCSTIVVEPPSRVHARGVATPRRPRTVPSDTVTMADSYIPVVIEPGTSSPHHLKKNYFLSFFVFVFFFLTRQVIISTDDGTRGETASRRSPCPDTT